MKVLLGVNQSTASSAVYGGCARLPVCYAAIKNSKILVSSNQKAWISDVKKMNCTLTNVVNLLSRLSLA